MRRIFATAFGWLALVLASTSAPTAEPVRIGLGVPLSGPDAIFGDQIRLGVDQAISDLNRSGGFLGQIAQAVPRDDGSDPKTAVAVAKEFAASHVGVVIGHFSSAATVPASVIYSDAGILEITPTATGPLVTDRGLPLMFRIGDREDQQAAVAVRFLLARRVTKVAILHDRTSNGKALADSIRTALAAAGKPDVFYGSLEKGAHDATGLVARLKASGAQIAIWGGGGAEAGLLARQLREANANVTILGGLAMASDEFPAAAGPAADGTLMVFPRDPRTLPAAADLLHRMTAAGTEPGTYVVSAYAAIQVLDQAMQAAQTLDPKTLGATMHSGRIFKTVIGDFTFDAKGDPVPPDLAVYVWHKGAGGHMTFDDLAKS